MRIGWFTSAWDEQAVVLLRGVAEAICRDEIEAELATVLCTRSPADSPHAIEIFRVAGSAGSSFLHLSPEPEDSTIEETLRGRGRESWRQRFEEAVISALEPHKIDLVVLAGYMWVAGPCFLENLRMINLHPAPPGGAAGTREEVLEELVRSEDRQAGAMVHVVTDELDRGPALVYGLIPLEGAEWDELWLGRAHALRDAVEHQILKLEPRLLVAALKRLAEIPSDPWPPALIEPLLVTDHPDATIVAGEL